MMPPMRGRPPGIRPDIAFIVDIRRENRALHLLYKALFELSVDRGDFVSRLFSRRRPPAASANTGVKELFDAYETVSADRGVFTENLSLIRSRLLEMHRIALTPEDLASIESLYDAFHSRGPTINYRQGDLVGPAFSTLMANEDIFGGERSFLAGEESFRYVKNLHERNLIVPLVGDFAGPHTLRRVGEFLREHDETCVSFTDRTSRSI